MIDKTANSIHTKASDERKYLDLWIDLNPEAPKGKIVKSESPDFVVHYSRKHKAGIEITQWMANSGTDDNFLPKFNPSEILSIIHSKQEKLPLYRKQLLNRTILIIVLLRDGFQPFTFPQNMSYWIPSVLFDELYILDYDLNRLYRMK